MSGAKGGCATAQRAVPVTHKRQHPVCSPETLYDRAQRSNLEDEGGSPISGTERAVPVQYPTSATGAASPTPAIWEEEEDREEGRPGRRHAATEGRSRSLGRARQQPARPGSSDRSERDARACSSGFRADRCCMASREEQGDRTPTLDAPSPQRSLLGPTGHICGTQDLFLRSGLHSPVTHRIAVTAHWRQF